MKSAIIGASAVALLSLLGTSAYGKNPVKAYVTVKAYHQEQNGNPKNPESQVRVEVSFPDKKKIELPEANKFWSVSNKQTQDINETFEVPQEFLVDDGFSFEVNIVQKGKEILPCQIRVSQLSQFNRTYFCRTDANAQEKQYHLKEDKVVKQAVELRVFTDANSTGKEIPKKLVALRKP